MEALLDSDYASNNLTKEEIKIQQQIHQNLLVQQPTLMNIIVVITLRKNS
jgi:hypothetical protein